MSGRGRERVAARLAGPVLGLALNGFFLYIGLLELLGTSPRPALTGAWYALIGGAMAALAWSQRATLRERIGRGGRPLALFALTGVALAALFLASAAFASEGDLARRLAFQLVLWTIPAVLLALSLSRQQLDRALAVIVVLGLAFAALELVALAQDSGADDRFSPFSELDPITAAHIPAFACVALLALPGGRARTALGALALAALVAGTVLPGSRGPLLALGVGLAVYCAASWRTTGFRVLGAVALGVAAGLLLASQAGSSRHLISDLPREKAAEDSRPPISSLRIRQRLIAKALGDVAEKPLLGHGVGMLVDDTPEAYRMGIAGRRTYPHNNFVEAAYSLGLVGLGLFSVALGASLWALGVLIRRRRSDRLAVFAAAFFAFAFVNANLSGELAAYPWSWAAAAIVLVLYAGIRPVLNEPGAAT